MADVMVKYRARKVPENELHEETVLVFAKTDGTKKGATGLYEMQKRKAKGEWYDVTLPRDRGEIRVRAEDFKKLGLRETPQFMDTETLDDVPVGGF